MMIKEEIKDLIAQNPHLKDEYEATDDKWLFVEYNILDLWNLPATENNINIVEDMLYSA